MNPPIMPIMSLGRERTKSVLTVEMCSKWYYLLLIHPDNSVDVVAFPTDDRRIPDEESCVGDHCVNPLAVVYLANDNGWVVDPVALEVLIGRWELDYKSSSPYHRCLEEQA